MSSEASGNQEHFRFVRSQPDTVFGRAPTFQEVLMYLSGFNAAQGFGTLGSFWEWLVVKLGTGYEYHWYGTARALAFDHDVNVRPVPTPSVEDDAAAAVRLLDLVVEYLDDVSTREGRRAIYRAFEELRASDGLP